MAKKRTVLVDMPGSPKGMEVEVPGLGVFKNGAETELTDEQIETWETVSRHSFPESGKLKLPVTAVHVDVDEDKGVITVSEEGGGKVDVE